MRGTRAREIRNLAKIVMKDDVSMDIDYKEIQHRSGHVQRYHSPESYRGIVNILKTEYKQQNRARV